MRRPRTNLPHEQNSFVGRDSELRALGRALGTTRALTLCGTGGIGKTRLAVRLLAAVSDGYPDGVWLVELGDLREPSLVAGRVAAVVGVDPEPGRPLPDTLADALRPRRTLIALDNCEHLIDACARLCQGLLAAAPGLQVVATSREPLRVPAETVWQVPPLPVPPPAASVSDAEVGRSPAVRLFADRAAAARPGFALTAANSAAVAAVCRTLDGVPLAVELAAARVRALSVEQIAARLVDRFDLLRSGDRTAPARHRTLRAAIDWSHGLLSTPEKVLLRRLSVFAGWSLEMSEQVCAGDGLPADDVLELTAALVDKSLVMVEPEALGQARYRLLDSIREYAARRLAEAGEAGAVQARLRDYALEVTERAAAVGMGAAGAPWSAAVDVFRRYDVDADNARQVLARCLATGDAEAGLRIATAIRPCWIARGAFAEGSDWLGRLLGLPGDDVPSRVRGAALVGRAQLVLANEPATAQAWTREGLAACRSTGEDAWTATALNVLAEAAMHAGQADDAGEHASEALAVARAVGDAWDEGYALGTLASLAAWQGRLRQAQRLGESALAVMRAIDQQWGVARTLLGLGALARLRGDPADALRCHLAALPILREIDSRPETARCLAGIGRVALDQGEIDLARERLTESLRLSHATGARVGVARGLEAFAELAGADGRPDAAVRLTAAAAALRESAGLPPLSGARTQRHLAPARRLGEAAVSRLWAEGRALTGDEAVAFALAAVGTPDQPLDDPPGPPHPDGASRAGRAGHPVAPPPALTPRERQVVALVAAGASNKAVAADLVISPATAARHVANILAKLGFSSRAQIAAWATGDGADGPDSE